MSCDARLLNGAAFSALTGQIDWTCPSWISDELVMEEAHRRAANGEGTVHDDGHPPAQWIPKESE